MQKFFFDMRDGVPNRDRVGIEFSTNAEAITYCKAMAQDFRDHSLRNDQDLEIMVVNEIGREGLQLSAAWQFDRLFKTPRPGHNATPSPSNKTGRNWYVPHTEQQMPGLFLLLKLQSAAVRQSGLL